MSNTKLMTCFSEALGLPPERITDDLAYQGVPEWDSTAHMALVAILEQEFDLMLSTDDILAMSSFAMARNILQKQGVAF